MTFKDNIEYRDNVHDWVCKFPWIYPMFVTLTVKQYDSWGNRVGEYEQDQSLRHFIKRMEAASYGSIQRRKGKRLNVFPVAEVSANGRRHFHLLIDNPNGLVLEDYDATVRSCWSNTTWGDGQVNVQEDGMNCLNYVTKFKTKPDFAEGILVHLARTT